MSKVSSEGKRKRKEAYANRLRNLLDTSPTRETVNLDSFIDFISTQMSEFSNFELNLLHGSREEDSDGSKSKERNASDPTHEVKKPKDLRKEGNLNKSKLKEKESSKPKSKERNSNNSESEEDDDSFESKEEKSNNSRSKEKDSSKFESNETNSNSFNTRNHDSCQLKSRKRSVSSHAELNRYDVSRERNSNNSVSNRYVESGDQDCHAMRPQERPKQSELDWPRSPVPDLIIEYVVPQDKHDEPPEFYRRLLRKALKFYRRLVVDGEDISDVSTDVSLDSNIETRRKTNSPSEPHLDETFEIIKTSVEITAPNVEIYHRFKDQNIQDASNTTTLKAFPVRMKIKPRSKTDVGNEPSMNKERSSTMEKWNLNPQNCNQKASKYIPDLVKEPFSKPKSNPYREVSGPLPGLREASPSSLLGSMEDEWREDSDMSVSDGRQSTPVETDTWRNDTSESSETMFKVVTFRADVHAPRTMPRNRGQFDRQQNYERSLVKNIDNSRDKNKTISGSKTPILSQSVLSQFNPGEVNNDQEELEDTAVSQTDQLTSREEIEEMRCFLPHRATSSLGNKPNEQPNKDDVCDNFKTNISLERAAIENTADDAEIMDYDQEQSNGDHDLNYNDRTHSNSDSAPRNNDHTSSHSDHATMGIRKRRLTFPLHSEPKRVKFLSRGVQTDINNCEYCSSFTSSLRGENSLRVIAEVSRDESNKQDTRTGSRQYISNEDSRSSTIHLSQGNKSDVGNADVTSSQRRSDVQDANVGSEPDAEKGARGETMTTQVSELNPQSAENKKTSTQIANIEYSQVKRDAQIVTIAATQDFDMSTGRAKDRMSQCKSNTQTTNDSTRQWESNTQSGNEDTSQRKSNTQSMNEESSPFELNPQSANGETSQRESNTQNVNEESSHFESNPQSRNKKTNQSESNIQNANEGTSQRESLNGENERMTQSVNKETSRRESKTQSANDGTSQHQSNSPNANEGTSQRQSNPQSKNNDSNENIFYDIKFVGRQIVIKNCHCSDCPVIAKMFRS